MIPRMFAALILLSVAGIVIYFALAGLSYLLLRRWQRAKEGDGQVVLVCGEPGTVPDGDFDA